MSLELRIVSGPGAGRRQRFDKALISLGRHPHSDFRFDPDRDLDVSARHAEIRREGDSYVIRDTGSRTGIFVNGTKVEECVLGSGDEVRFGENGPVVQVRDSRFEIRDWPGDSGLAMPPESRISNLESRNRPITVAALLVALVAVLAYAIAFVQARRREQDIMALVARTDSLTALYNRNLAQMAGQMHQLDSALGAARAERDRLRASAQPSPSTVDLMAQMKAAEERRRDMNGAADYTKIAERNGSAVALLAVEWEDGKHFTGSGFSVTREGLIVTNRHLVQRDGAKRPKRLMVIFSDTRLWLPARIVRISDEADLALIQVEVAGPFPTVAGVSRSASHARVGSPVAIIGYPLGIDTPMEGSGVRITARSTLGAGTLSKNIPDVVQIDGFAGDGSSGSPVFDGAGHVIAVVYGGAREAQNRIVYAVPTDKLMAMLPIEARGLLK
ncbi:MAG TPA: trypsin-like peptidase domain-containing protein [Gemmatimonadaceae bacterium]|nr:trypsin-like peptidase domain-containing protein [Gemmatimonadaceae bacterium]